MYGSCQPYIYTHICNTRVQAVYVHYVQTPNSLLRQLLRMSVEAHTLLRQRVTQGVVHSQLLEGEAGDRHEGIVWPDCEPEVCVCACVCVCVCVYVKLGFSDGCAKVFRGESPIVGLASGNRGAAN